MSQLWRIPTITDQGPPNTRYSTPSPDLSNRLPLGSRRVRRYLLRTPHIIRTNSRRQRILSPKLRPATPHHWRFHHSQNQQEIFQRGLQRFLPSGRILAKLNHPHVVRVTDLFEENETAYLVMELVTGKSLRKELDSQPHKKLSPQKVKEIITYLISALSTVHQQGILHLDIKPDNILLTPEGQLVLIDFGSAKQTFSSSMGTSSTRTFTESYAAPEVLAGGEVGVESDIFEVGMMVYEMLSGQLPPNALQRFLLKGKSWEPEGLESSWQKLITSALVLEKEGRPGNIEKWWEINFQEKSTDRTQESELKIWEFI